MEPDPNDRKKDARANFQSEWREVHWQRTDANESDARMGSISIPYESLGGFFTPW